MINPLHRRDPVRHPKDVGPTGCEAIVAFQRCKGDASPVIVIVIVIVASSGWPDVGPYVCPVVRYQQPLEASSDRRADIVLGEEDQSDICSASVGTCSVHVLVQLEPTVFIVAVQPVEKQWLEVGRHSPVNEEHVGPLVVAHELALA